MRHADEGVTGHVHRQEEALARAVDHAPLQVLLRGKRDRVQGEIELAPAPFDRLKHRLELALDLDVEWQEDRRLKLLGQRLNIGLGLVVQISDGEFGAKRRNARAQP